jgi:MFS family permease
MEQPTNLFELQLDQSSINYLNESARWARFLAIIGFIFCGLMVIVGIFFGGAMAGMMSGMSGETAQLSGAFSVMISFAYIVAALITFFPSLYLFLFGSRMRKAIHNNDQPVLTDALKNLKSFFKFYGIIMIITLSIYALAIIFGIVGAMIGSRH